MNFVMIIKEIFNFQDGRTIFVGEINDRPHHIKKCNCKLYVANKLYGEIKIEGEMIPRGTQSQLRSLSSLDKIDISKLPYKDIEIRLVCDK